MVAFLSAAVVALVLYLTFKQDQSKDLKRQYDNKIEHREYLQRNSVATNHFYNAKHFYKIILTKNKTFKEREDKVTSMADTTFSIFQEHNKNNYLRISIRAKSDIVECKVQIWGKNDKLKKWNHNYEFLIHLDSDLQILYSQMKNNVNNYILNNNLNFPLN